MLPHALALLRRESGSKFDPRCVDAIERVLARESAAARAPHEPLATAGAVLASG